MFSLLSVSPATAVFACVSSCFVTVMPYLVPAPSESSFIVKVFPVPSTTSRMRAFEGSKFLSLKFTVMVFVSLKYFPCLTSSVSIEVLITGAAVSIITFFESSDTFPALSKARTVISTLLELFFEASTVTFPVTPVRRSDTSAPLSSVSCVVFPSLATLTFTVLIPEYVPPETGSVPETSALTSPLKNPVGFSCTATDARGAVLSAMIPSVLI